jgi:FtsP/CotA-like multicopper oxidase with cupredoxin domain
MKFYYCLFLISSCFFRIGLQAQVNPFNLPPVLNGPVYNLNMQNGTRQFNPGITSSTKGFNGNILGPTLIMQAGERVYMNVTNSIGEETTVHWHGFHVAPENDGGPHTVIDPNTTWTPNFPVLDKAGTYWYHPHAHFLTAKHVLQGLAGLIIVKDPEEEALNLPRTYGVDDFPLIIQTKAISSTGEILFDGSDPNLDSNLMVNAVKRSQLNVPRQMVRFRILNGSNQRVFNLGLSNNATFYHIATDGGLKPTRTSLTRLRLAPGERGEIVVPFGSYSVGTNLQLMSYGNELPSGTWGAATPWINFINPVPNYTPNYMNGAAFTVLRLFVTATTASPVTTAPPSSLGSDTPIPEAQATFTRNKWLFSGTVGGGAGVRIGSSSSYAAATEFDMNVVNDVIPLDRTEIWTLHGAADQYHPFHIHDIQFYILDREDSLGNNIPLTSNEIGRKDVVSVGPKETVRFITKFDDFWGDVPYMYHCHITVHEDKGMMKQFVINRSLYVDKNYTGALELGSQTFPYKTLRGAVEAAQEGTTIYFVSSGVHEEITSPTLLIQKKISIKLIGTAVTVQ